MFRAMDDDEDDFEVTTTTRPNARPKVFKGELRKSPLSPAMTKIVRKLHETPDADLVKIKPADLNRAIGEAVDHGGIWVLMRSIKERGLVSFTGHGNGLSNLKVDRAKCETALADPRKPRRR